MLNKRTMALSSAYIVGKSKYSIDEVKELFLAKVPGCSGYDQQPVQIRFEWLKRFAGSFFPGKALYIFPSRTQAFSSSRHVKINISLFKAFMPIFDLLIFLK
ncbi:hypothetical protein HPL003_06445 [Paenibacillus terrae HPL-003]|uniref:Uncharacterized protein n=1 Tax=Paenibacillus terrae (strain HPL-003) TaxID=985665 RepID=G7W1P8_PAETH|nr:hypothetical protein HPL003_06445 [Paenibacillus terrae HPL-003]